MEAYYRRTAPAPPQTITTRSTGNAELDEFLELISNPFQASFTANLFLASLGTSIVVFILLAALFSFVRPRHTLVYAPKAKHADDKHAPPPIGKGPLAWLHPVLTTKEDVLVDKIGLDAVVFLRFTRMLRNIFLILAFIGLVVMIPVNVAGRVKSISGSSSAFAVMTPLFLFGSAFWSHVLCAWAFDIIIAYFLWRNYGKIRDLKRAYFQTSEYQMSLHGRTLMITDVPPKMRTDEGLHQLTEQVNSTGSMPRTTIGRNVKILPSLIGEHEQTVEKLEGVLAKYLKNPDTIPGKRPLIRAPHKYRGETIGGKVDTIEYLSNHIRELEDEIAEVRESVDKRHAMPYGFASWEHIEQAHTVAYSARKKHPQGTTIVLAPRPNDLIWENLALGKSARRTKRLMNFVWVTILTLLWTPINGAIAIFLADLTNLGRVWHGFQTQLYAHPKWWALVQGVASPALTSLVYLILPVIFRRLSIRAGDTTKTARDHHVIHNLFAFFVFNNLLVFSLFSAIWSFVTTVIKEKQSTANLWDAIVKGDFYTKVMLSLCQVSPFWVTWLLQRDIGAAVDLAQLANLSWVWFIRTFMAPTPRQNILWTAPPRFDYASYYNYFLFYATIALCFSTLQPVVLIVTAFYFSLDAVMKKYLLMYVFITKTESGGQAWRVLFNRMIFATVLSNIIIGLVVIARGTWTMIFVLAPAPLLMLGFKWYCATTFDNDIKYYVRTKALDQEDLAAGARARRTDRVTSKFGHPALYRRLRTPMVHARAQQILSQVYRGRLNSDSGRSMAFSDIALEPIAQNGKAPQPVAPFEIVPEGRQDFSYYKNRGDFREEFSGGIYGDQDDLSTERSQTPKSFLMKDTDLGSPHSSGATTPERGTIPRKEFDQRNVHPAFRSGHTTRSSSGDREAATADLGMTPLVYHDPYMDESRTNLLDSPQSVGHSMPASAVGEPLGEQMGMDRWKTGSSGYGPVEQQEEATSYDWFRQKR